MNTLSCPYVVSILVTLAPVLQGTGVYTVNNYACFCVSVLTGVMFTVAARWMIQTGTTSFSRRPLQVNTMVTNKIHQVVHTRAHTQHRLVSVSAVAWIAQVILHFDYKSAAF